MREDGFLISWELVGGVDGMWAEVSILWLTQQLHMLWASCPPVLWS